MHIGFSVPFQNPFDARSDAEVYHRRAGLRPPGGDVGLRLDLDGRAPLHRLHDVSGPAAAPDVPGRPDPPHPARHGRHRPALARPGAAGGADHPARQPVRWAGPARHRPGHRQGRVRRLPGADGHLAPALPGVRRRRPARSGGRLRRARRRVHPAASPGLAPAPPALLPRPHLRRRGLPGLHAADGTARRRPAGDRPEAVGEGAGGLRRLPGDVGRGERGRPAGPDLQRLPVRRRGQRRGPRSSRTSTSATTTARSCATTPSTRRPTRA